MHAPLITHLGQPRSERAEPFADGGDAEAGITADGELAEPGTNSLS
jgi:hypothetical protein